MSPRFMRESRALPAGDETQLILAMVDPVDLYVQQAFALATHRTVVPRLALPSEWDAAFERLYGSGKTSMDQIVGEVETRRTTAPMKTCNSSRNSLPKRPLFAWSV